MPNPRSVVIALLFLSLVVEACTLEAPGVARDTSPTMPAASSSASTSGDSGPPAEAGDAGPLAPSAPATPAATPPVCAGVAYFISPGGSDTAAGDHDHPWKTFAHALDKTRLTAGDCLFLEAGTFDRASTGLPVIDCSATGHAASGTATAPITFASYEERKAFIRGDGHSAAFVMRDCSHWNVVGLHVEDADGDPAADYGGTMDFERNSDLAVRRNLIAHSNRCQNSHLVAFNYSNTRVLLEENEAYWFHRHAFLFFGASNQNEARRNYANSRNYAVSPICTYKTTPGGDGGGMNYGGSDNLWENSISENNSGFENQTVGTFPSVGGTPVGNDRWLGDISFHDSHGSESAPHTVGAAAHDITWQDLVVIHPLSTGVYSRSTSNAVLKNVSIFPAAADVGYVLADVATAKTDAGVVTPVGAGSYTFSATNSIIAGTGAHVGFALAADVQSLGLDHVGSHGGTISNVAVTNPFVGDPSFGACYLWVPDASPLKHAGAGGADIGANVLYAYEGGVLTTTRLWDPSTGAPRFAGAIVSGVNDVGAAGGSLADVATRFNINTNGCAFPKGY